MTIMQFTLPVITLLCTFSKINFEEENTTLIKRFIIHFTQTRGDDQL